MEDTWGDPIKQGDYIAKVAALQGHLQRQTARIESPIVGSGGEAKLITRKIYWTNECTLAVGNTTDECAAASNTADDASIDVTISNNKEVPFAVSMKQFRSKQVEMQDVIANNMLVSMKLLDEYLNAQYVLALEANKGTHEYSLPFGALNGSNWQIENTNWNEDIMPQFMLSAEFSRFVRPYVVSGVNSFADYQRSLKMAGNLNVAGIQNMYDTYNWVFDPITVEANAPNKSYLVNASALALVTGNYWSAVPTAITADHTVFSVPSRNLPGISYDIHQYRTCTSDDFVFSYKIRVNWSYILNPKGCTATRTGILAFERLVGI